MSPPGDYVRVISGTITVAGAVSGAIHTNEAFSADGGTLNLEASNDGIQVEEGYLVISAGTLTVNVADKGIAATHDTDNIIDPYLTINSTGGEGIESQSILASNGGATIGNIKDDGLNAGTFLSINGGQHYLYSTSNDAVASNGKITITGGLTVAAGTTGVEEGFDCDKNTFKVTGGPLPGIGGPPACPRLESLCSP